MSRHKPTGHFGSRKQWYRLMTRVHDFGSPTNKRKKINRDPFARRTTRATMMRRLAAEVREREVAELLDKQQFGVTKPKRTRRVKSGD